MKNTILVLLCVMVCAVTIGCASHFNVTYNEKTLAWDCSGECNPAQVRTAIQDFAGALMEDGFGIVNAFATNVAGIPLFPLNFGAPANP